ncbi:MAG TPA: ATP-binding protein [Bryobacteraceae bacterium]|jgi:signal transduction histidine kinase|nr:ATP-binding protein [Bryobacteraceae bacterium]
MPGSLEEQTVYIFAPTGRDARLIVDTLSEADILAKTCSSRDELSRALQTGAAAAIISEEALSSQDVQELARHLESQPFWSDLPILLLTFAGRPTPQNISSGRAAEVLGNVTLLERPLRPMTLRAAVRSAIRARMRQYQLRRRQESLQHAISELEQFAYSASHDLREPLRNIAIFSELLEKEHLAALDKTGRQYCNFVRASAKRMETLIDDLLAYTRLNDDESHNEPTTADAAKCVEMALASLSTAITESGAEIEVGPLPVVSMRSTHLYQIFQNLLANAVKYRGEAPPRIRVSASREEGFGWRFAVKDNGIGISPEYQERIFGLFKRLHTNAKYSGSGIGLAICQRIVQRSGGKIWVESEPGRGSTFYFTVKHERLAPGGRG